MTIDEQEPDYESSVHIECKYAGHNGAFHEYLLAFYVDHKLWSSYITPEHRIVKERNKWINRWSHKVDQVTADPIPPIPSGVTGPAPARSSTPTGRSPKT